ncbi:DHHW family protein [Hominifimenecus sp. rT4P-3]|uniref:DHHW family protein n=1 Tax=Hominifimenecus sp. rT4P-3 TaxID=3242979 RepID=UPI003DA58E6F
MNTQKKDQVICIFAALVFLTGFLLCVFLPKAEYSESERRKLAAMPEISPSRIWDGRFMTDFESYTVDTFPFREQMRTIKAWTATKVFGRQDNNGIYCWDGFLSAIEYPLHESSFKRAEERFRYVCGKYLTEKNRVFLSVIPDKNCFLAQKSGHLSMDYAEIEKWMAQNADFAEYITISDLLDRDDYYKTDTHWRQEKIVDVAERLAQAMDADVLTDYEIRTLEQEFYGVYYGQSALPAESDTLQYLTNAAIQECTAYDWQNRKDMPVYDLERAGGKDPYELFLSGPLSLVTIENPTAQTDKKLVMFRDSFGSSIAPLLIGGYSQITLVDIRYIQPDYLGQFIDFDDCDVLFLYSTLVLNHSETLK